MRIEQLSSTELNARYFANRTDGLRVAGGVGRVVGHVVRPGWDLALTHTTVVRDQHVEPLDVGRDERAHARNGPTAAVEEQERRS